MEKTILNFHFDYLHPSLRDFQSEISFVLSVHMHAYKVLQGLLCLCLFLRLFFISTRVSAYQKHLCLCLFLRLSLIFFLDDLLTKG